MSQNLKITIGCIAYLLVGAILFYGVDENSALFFPAIIWGFFAFFPIVFIGKKLFK